MTTEELDRLAKMAGLVEYRCPLSGQVTKYLHEVRSDVEGVEPIRDDYCDYDDWQPHEKGHADQMMLVLEALIEHVRDWEFGNCRCGCGCGGVGVVLGMDYDDEEAIELDCLDTIAEAVCKAALAVEGGG